MIKIESEAEEEKASNLFFERSLENFFYNSQSIPCSWYYDLENSALFANSVEVAISRMLMYVVSLAIQIK